MIFLNKKLKRFIYFEIATHGIRIFDPCYCATSILTGRFRDKKARLKWFSLLKSIFKGYNSINRLKKVEINAIFYVLLSIQLLFMAYMVKINRIKIAKFNQSALKWIYDNENTINKELQTS